MLRPYKSMIAVLQAIGAVLKKRPWILLVLGALALAGWQAARAWGYQLDVAVAKADTARVQTKLTEAEGLIALHRAQSELEAANAAQASLRAAQERKRTQREIERLRREHVPSACTEAVAWAAVKAAEVGRW